MDGEKLYVCHVVANQGPTYKRLLIRAKGKQDVMKKRTSHLVVQVSDNLKEFREENKKLLKPRAHQHKQPTQLNQPSTAIEVERKVFDDKGAVH